MEKPKITETIVVEGRYDKNTLSQIVDAHIIETRGFGIFSDEKLLTLIQDMANRRGVIIMTDGDGAGLVIRNYLKGTLRGGRVLNAYIPDVEGKEKRKTRPSRERKLGVEGMSREVIIGALRIAGATFDGGGEAGQERARKISKTDLYMVGLSGRADSAAKRKCLLKHLDLPEHMSTNSLLQVLNSVYTYEEFIGSLYLPDRPSL